MDLIYSDEQNALRDAADRVLKASRATGRRWHEMASLGWLGLPLPEAHGGLGGSMVDVAILAEAMGRHLVNEPYVSRIVLAGGLVASACEPKWQQRLLPDLLDGSTKIAPVVDGVAFDAADVELFVIVHRHAGGQLSADIQPAASLTIQPFPTVDGRTAARVTATPPADPSAGANTDAIEHVLDNARAALAADMVGAMQAALDATVAYAKVRVQFGQPIGANQVVKHRLVEMAVKVEEARSLALLAAIRCSDGSAHRTRARAVSSAKVKIAAHARAVTEDAIQLHGAMGVTDELQIGHYLKRAIAFEAVLGTSRWHKARYANSRPEQD